MYPRWCSSQRSLLSISMIRLPSWMVNSAPEISPSTRTGTMFTSTVFCLMFSTVDWISTPSVSTLSRVLAGRSGSTSVACRPMISSGRRSSRLLPARFTRRTMPLRSAWTMPLKV